MSRTAELFPVSRNFSVSIQRAHGAQIGGLIPTLADNATAAAGRTKLAARQIGLDRPWRISRDRRSIVIGPGQPISAQLHELIATCDGEYIVTIEIECRCSASPMAARPICSAHDGGNAWHLAWALQL